MSVISTLPTSRRGYLSQTELAEYADITILDTTEADDQISQAEEIIDGYVGYQDRFMDCELVGYMNTVTSSGFTLYATHQNMYDDNYLVRCEVEIMGGTGSGQRRKLTASTKAGIVTIDTAWTVTPDNTSFYRIYQLGKFPRNRDVRFFSEVGTPTYFKSIPEEIKRAVAAQVEFKINMGDTYFSTDKSEKVSESIGDYSYTNAQGASGSTGANKLVAPKAKTILKGIMNRTGAITY